MITLVNINDRQSVMIQKMNIQNFEKIKLLGEGTYGKCYLALDKSKNEHCVLKQIEIVGLTQQQINQSVRQAHILEALDHPCIIKFLGSFQSKDGNLNIIMGYAESGDLSQKIKQFKDKDQTLPENQILTWFTQICCAIKHVHNRKIIHRDLKAQNIFITKQGNAKLGDFGIAKHLQHTIQKIKSVVGTPYYMSPEICQNKEYSFKADIWSLGVILLEMCLLKPPFDANSLPVLALRISKGEYFPVPKHYSKQLKKLISDLLQVDPIKRPNITQVCNHPLIYPRIDLVLPRQIKQLQFSHTTLHSINIFNKMPSRGLFIDCKFDEQSSPVEKVVSPKGFSIKNNDMPVKRVDNYMKQHTKIPTVDKKSKKGQLKKREISEPNLTPRNHTKIQNQRKVMVKNNSVLNFDKKKSLQKQKQKEIAFKKKAKINFEQAAANHLQQIRQSKKQIQYIHGQISHRQVSKKLSFSEELDVVDQFQKLEEKDLQEQQLIQERNQSDEETELQTLQSLILQLTGQSDLEEMYQSCKDSNGICLVGPCAGLMTIAFALRNQEF